MKSPVIHAMPTIRRWIHFRLFLATAAIFLATTSAVRAGTFTAFGPRNYTRGTGAPVTITDTFCALNSTTQYTLKVFNGGTQNSQVELVSSSVITLNGVQVLGPNNFNQNISEVDVPVTLQASNTFSVQVRGQPGGVLTIQIVGVDNGLPTISPTSGPVGTLVTLTGLNFTSCGAIPQVTLNQQAGGAIPAPVSVFHATSLSFVVPDGAATGAVTVTVGTQSATSGNPFTVTTSSTFTLTVTPNSGTLIQGQSTTFAVTLSGNNGFSGLASLGVSGVPSGVSASFKPPQITPGQISVLTLAAPASQAAATSTLSISASAAISGQSVTRSATASLQVTGVSTSLLGRTVVDDSPRTPISGVTIKFLGVDDKGNVTGCSAHTTSDAAGNFALTGLPAACTGPQLVSYDGSTATSPAGKFAGVNLSYTLTSGQVTTSPVLIHLPRIDNAETVQVQQNASTDQVLTFHSMPSLVVTVYAGTKFSLDDGSQPNPFPLIGVEVPVDRLPDAIATSGKLMPFIVAFQPANAVSSQPVAVNFPNSLNMPPGATATFMTLDPTRGYMVPYGTGTVSKDGTQFIADPDPAYPGHGYGLVHFDWHGPITEPPPPHKCPPGECCGGVGQPIDPSSGIAVVEATDIAINGPRGSISVVRTFRGRSANAGPFGLGTTHNYSYRLDTAFTQTAAVINLIVPGSDRYPFSVQPDGRFTNSTIPSLRGAVMTVHPDGSVSLRWKDGTTYLFVPATFQVGSVLTSIIDVNGNVISLVHGNSLSPIQITQVIDTVGRQLTLNYDTVDRITSIVDPIGRTVSYTYNSQGTLATVTDPQGGVAQYHYDSQNNLTQETDARSVMIAQNTYDANGRVVQQVQADGGIIKFEYILLNPIVPNSPVLLTTVTDAQGNQTSYHYNPEGFLIDATDATGQIRLFNRKSGTNELLSITGTASCNVCGASGAGDQSFTYDANGNRLTQTDALGNTTTFIYDPVFNKVTSITDPLGNPTRFTYDSHGNLLTRSDPNGNITAFAYDSFGQLTQITDPLGQKTTLAHNSVGDLVSTTDPLGNTTSTVYDRVSRPIVVRDTVGRVTQTAYDSLDRVVTRTNAQNKSTQFSYDAVGNRLSVTDPKGNKTSFVYDSMSRLVGRTDPLGKIETRNYDFDGDLINFVDRRGQTSQFTYDSLNRLVGENHQDGSTVTRSYDATGRLLHVVDSVGGVFDFAYDLDGHLKSSATQFGTLQYSYDSAGRVNSRQVVGQSPLQYSYDATGNLLAAALPQAAASFTYDVRNQILALNRSNGVSTAYTYDADGRILSMTHSGASGLLDTESYTYDAVGNRSASSKGIAHPLVTQPVNNQYNAGNRLVQSTSANGTTAYSYDDNGNLISAVGSGGTTTYTWDSRNRLRAISKSNGQNTTFLYDFAGNLISQKDNGPSLNLTQTFVLDDLTNIALLSRSSGESLSVLTGRLIDQDIGAVHSNGQIDYSLKDGINSTVATTDQTGAIKTKFFYEPFGQTSSTGPTYPFQYTGRVPVSDSLYNYRARYYDPTTERFISEDPIALGLQGPNAYGYVLNDPIDLEDPAGLFSTSDYIRKKVVEKVAEKVFCYGAGEGVAGFVCEQLVDYTVDQLRKLQNPYRPGRKFPACSMRESHLFDIFMRESHPTAFEIFTSDSTVQGNIFP